MAKMNDAKHETSKELMDRCVAKYDFKAYVMMDRDERQQWRFQHIKNMNFDEIVAFFEYCIEPEELRDGVHINIDGDVIEARKRLDALKEERAKEEHTVKQLELENRRLQKKLQDMSADQARRDAEWNQLQAQVQQME